VYGGSALILTLDARPATQDVDAVFERDRAFVRDAAASIAVENDWDSGWLNDGVKCYLSAADADPEAKALFRSYPSETHAGLRVMVASPPYLFAMKYLAMRIGGVEQKQDVADIRRLGALLNVRNAIEALAIVERYYAAERLSPKTR